MFVLSDVFVLTINKTECRPIAAWLRCAATLRFPAWDKTSCPQRGCCDSLAPFFILFGLAPMLSLSQNHSFILRKKKLELQWYLTVIIGGPSAFPPLISSFVVFSRYTRSRLITLTCSSCAFVYLYFYCCYMYKEMTFSAFQCPLTQTGYPY